MKNLLSRIRKIFWSSKTAKGFTLIELLIVIAILGILTTAVLSAINPVEQINRGRDTGSKSDAEQLLSAMQRFNATQGYYVWESAPDSHPVQLWKQVTAADPTEDAAVAGTAVLTKLGPTGENELLPAFNTRITGADYNPLFVYNRGGQGDSTYVCFKPQSKSLEKEATTRCNAAPDDFPPAADACIDAANPTPTLNYICLP